MKTKKEHESRQLKALDDFYRGYFQKENKLILGYRVSTIAMLVLAGIFMLIPYSVVKDNVFLIVVAVSTWYGGGEMYLSIYRKYLNSQNKSVSVWGILQNLPFTKCIWYKYLFKKLMVFQFVFYMVMQGLVILIIIGRGHDVVMADLGVCALTYMIFPLLMNGYTILRDL